jgi:hypothetical protein
MLLPHWITVNDPFFSNLAFYVGNRLCRFVNRGLGDRQILFT